MGLKAGSLPSRERGLKSQRQALLGSRYGSLPSRERGLKYQSPNRPCVQAKVAPFTGAWIEIRYLDSTGWKLNGRSLHGSVD